MNRSKRSGQLALAVFTALHYYFLSVWERTLTLPSPKGRGWARINSLGAMSQFRFHAQTLRIGNSRKCQTLRVPQQSWGLPTINHDLPAPPSRAMRFPSVTVSYAG